MQSFYVLHPSGAKGTNPLLPINGHIFQGFMEVESE